MTQHIKNRPGVSDFTRATADSLNLPGSIIQKTQEHAKRLATISAELALVGFSCRGVVAGGWLVSSHDQAFYCATLADLELILSEVQQ